MLLYTIDKLSREILLLSIMQMLSQLVLKVERGDAHASWHGDSINSLLNGSKRALCGSNGHMFQRWLTSSVMIHVERDGRTNPNEATPRSTAEHQLVLPRTASDAKLPLECSIDHLERWRPTYEASKKPPTVIAVSRSPASLRPTTAATQRFWCYL